MGSDQLYINYNSDFEGGVVFHGSAPVAIDGNVGIGTRNPTHKLSVNGSIRAKEIFIETGWADFVFDADYNLPTLDEVARHISEEGHLPGVPSAADVSERGLAVGEAQTLMMQKIEELTLYLLEMKRENDALRQEVVALRQTISNL